MCRSSSKIVLKRCRHFPLGCVWNFTPRILTRHLDKEARGFRLFTRPFRTLGARIFRRSNLKLNVRSPNSRYGSFHSNKPWSFTFLQTCSYPFVFIADSFCYDSRRFLQTFRSSQCDRFRRRMAVLYKFILRHCLRFFHEFSRRTNDFKTCSMRIWLMIRRSIHLKFKDKERVREKKGHCLRLHKHIETNEEKENDIILIGIFRDSECPMLVLIPHVFVELYCRNIDWRLRKTIVQCNNLLDVLLRYYPSKNPSSFSDHAIGKITIYR